MEKYKLIAPCHFGLEAVLKREIQELGYPITLVEDGRVTFEGDAAAICRANVFLRTPERILLKVGGFHAESFEDLFQGTKAIPWEQYIPKDGRFWVAKATGIKSKLFSPRDIQAVMKKAMVDRLGSVYGLNHFPENGADYPIRVTIMKDEVTVCMDTTGDSLHKRGYRLLTAKAPIAENLAAALIMLTPWKADRMNRDFLAESWGNLIPKKAWYEAVDEANDLIDDQVQTDIQGYDIDGEIIRAARENARNAGVDHLIHFQERPVSELRHPKKYGFVITNPPYGERLEDRESLPALYRQIGEAFRGLDCWSEYVITSYEDAERYIGRKADRNRKIYNGMIRTYYYQFLGPKPSFRSHSGVLPQTDGSKAAPEKQNVFAKHDRPSCERAGRKRGDPDRQRWGLCRQCFWLRHLPSPLRRPGSKQSLIIFAVYPLGQRNRLAVFQRIWIS